MKQNSGLVISLWIRVFKAQSSLIYCEKVSKA